MSSRKRDLHTGDPRWRAIRARVLAEQPLCPLCHALGRLVAAVDVDHRDGNNANHDRANLWGLCRSHHSEKTATEKAGRKFKPKGCDIHGNPLSREDW